MNTLFIEFRDPLFGIIVFFIFIFFVAISSYWWGRFKSRDEHKKLKSFMQQFEISPSNSDVDELLKNKNISIEAWIVIADAFNRQGEYEKSIKVYQHILKLESNSKNRTVMLSLGNTYLKAGFLERAKLIFLEILKRHPRTPHALHSLLLIYEKLRDYKSASEVLEPLQELEHECLEDELYLKAIQIINDIDLPLDTKVEQLLKIYNKHHKLTYLIFEYIFKNDPVSAWKNLDQSKCKDMLDILWNLEKSKLDLQVIEQNSFLSELYSAKGYVNYAEKSSIFEFDVLMKLPPSTATLQFEYFCQNCKMVYPFSFYRCPSCHEIDTQKCESILTKDSFEKNLSFQ